MTEPTSDVSEASKTEGPSTPPRPEKVPKAARVPKVPKVPKAPKAAGVVKTAKNLKSAEETDVAEKGETKAPETDAVFGSAAALKVVKARRSRKEKPVAEAATLAEASPAPSRPRKKKPVSNAEAVLAPAHAQLSGVLLDGAPAAPADGAREKKSARPRSRRTRADETRGLSGNGEVSEASLSAYGPAHVEPAAAVEHGVHVRHESAREVRLGDDHRSDHGGTHHPETGVSPKIEAAEVLRKPYPVYVPRHIAKQMEQEGRPAPLAIPCDAEHAAEIRAAAFENRHGLPQPREGVHAPQGEDERRREEHRESRDQRDARGPRDQRPSRDGRDSRRPQPGGPREATQGQQPRQHPGERLQERGGGAERDPRKGRHDRNDRRRGGHSEERFEGGQENGRELPPPTPEELFPGEGLIEISGKGFGFLRDPLHNFAQNPADIFVSPELVRRYNLKDGHWIKGSVRRSGRGRQIHEIETVNGDAPESCRLQPAFEELTVINPSEPLKMETVSERYTTRVIDMIAPIGKGQRGLIVAQPRTGKTTLLQHIADAMMKNHPDVHLIMLLVDERPEEVTEIRHTVPKAEIMASSNDMDVRSHTRIAELAIERAKRLVESGRDVFILLDSITRLGRAFNNAMTNGGRTMSGGIDARAMEVPRRLFAAARNTEEAGSLTIIATALIDTGSRMDEIIFQEFKGTGNMELVLDRKIAEQRIYPAVDIFQSGTRREELLVPADLLQKIYFLRRGLSGAKPLDAIDRLLFYLRKFPTNEQMLREIKA